MVKRPGGPFEMGCETFWPIILQKDQFEEDQAVRARINEWMEKNNPLKLINVESLKVRVISGVDFISGLGEMFYSSRRKLSSIRMSGQKVVLLHLYRLYFEK